MIEILEHLTNRYTFYLNNISRYKRSQHCYYNYFGVTDAQFTVTASFVILRAIAIIRRCSRRSGIASVGEPTREYLESHAMHDFSMNAQNVFALKDRADILKQKKE